MRLYEILAFDFGASSGRAILGTYDGTNLITEEIHRFENSTIYEDDTLFWNIDALISNLDEGIKKAGCFDSLGIDTWGVDFGLLDNNGSLLQKPVHYRDQRTNGIEDKVFQFITPQDLYSKTGNQIMNINTLFQLVAMKSKHHDLFNKAKKLLFMPDLLNFFLTGLTSCERTIASTSQIYNPTTKQWDFEIENLIGLSSELLQPIVNSGTILGSLLPKYNNHAKVIAVAGHDTQCAVASMPTDVDSAAFLSCGTWSLLGTELNAPILSELSRKSALSNETGGNGKINYLKNIIGLWLIQESKREWKRQGKSYTYADLEVAAQSAKPFASFIDPDASEFAVPGDIPERVKEYCRKTDQYVPQTDGEVMRCIYESLALKYRFALDQIKEITGKTFSTLHILGGGSKDQLLCSMTANCCNIKVVAGPVEATALGNMIIQLVALGALNNIEEGRDLIAKTQNLTTYYPTETGLWDKAFEKYKKIL